jgi:acetolactate synthase-1/2/3 large subunit
MKKRVADIIMETLVYRGITDCFAVVGGGAMYLDNALYRNADIHKYFCHHEQACAMAAEGYARYSGNIPLVCVTSGPGTTNTLTGVMGAWVDSIPMLIISGQMRYALTVANTGLPLRFRGSQEFNIVDTVKTMTKYSKMLLEPKEVKAEVLKAIDIATTGRRGPVWLDVPLDVQMAEIEEIEQISYDNSEVLNTVPSVSKKSAEHILEKLSSAKRPLIVAGNGIANSGNLDAFRSFADVLHIPVVDAAITPDALFRDSDIYYGISGSIGPRTGNFILENADCILTLGTSLGFKTTGYAQDQFGKNAYIMMVDVDEYEPKKPGVRTDEFIHSDLKKFFEVMKPLQMKIAVSDEWKKYCNYVKKRFTPFEAANTVKPDERVCAYYFWNEFEKYEPNDSIVVLANNTAISAKVQIGVKQDKQRVLVNNNCGSMGDDLPQAVGAAVAAKRDVVCVTGDGSVMMNLQELQTIKHYDLPVKIIIFTNDGYNAIRQTSKNFFNGEFIGCNADTGVSFPDFSKVARAFGYKYNVSHTNADAGEKIQWLFNTPGNLILEIEQRLDDPVIPKVMSRVDMNGNFVTPALEDMYPFISKEEHDELMKISSLEE